MDVSNRALLVGVAALAAGLIVAVSLAAYVLYGGPAVPVVTAPDPRPATPARPAIVRPVGADAAMLAELAEAKRRVDRLELLLERKTDLLEQKTRLLNERTNEIRNLKRQMDDSVAVIENLLRSEPAGEPGEPAADRPATPRAPNSPTEEELAWFRLQNDVELADLEEQLAGVNAELGTFREQANLELDLLVAEQQRQRQLFRQTLRRIGEPAITSLVEMLNDENAAVRVWAAETLGALQMRAIDAVPSLNVALTDPSPEVRSAAQRALEAIRE